MFRLPVERRPGPALALVCAVLLLAAGPVPAAQAQYASTGDWNRTSDTMAGALGVHFGKLGGHGFSVRYPLHWYLYLQASGGIWHTDRNKRHNVGVQLDYILRQDQKVRLYVNGGAAYFYHKERTSADGAPEAWDIDANWNTGGGVGVEYLEGERWSLQFEADFVHDGGNGDTKLVPQVGLYFYW